MNSSKTECRKPFSSSSRWFIRRLLGSLLCPLVLRQRFIFERFDGVGNFVHEDRRAGITEGQDNAPVTVFVDAGGQFVLVPFNVGHGNVLKGEHRDVDVFGGIFLLFASREVNQVRLLPVVVLYIPEVALFTQMNVEPVRSSTKALISAAKSADIFENIKYGNGSFHP